MLGQLGAMVTAGGGGDSHGCTVRGRPFAVIHLGQLLLDVSPVLSGPGLVPGGRSFLVFVSLFVGSGPKADEKLNVSLLIPIFFMAILVPKLENMLKLPPLWQCGTSIFRLLMWTRNKDDGRRESLPRRSSHVYSYVRRDGNFKRCPLSKRGW